MIKTVILNGSEVMISGPDGDNAEVHNFGNDVIRISKFPNIAPDADDVKDVPPNAIDGLTGTGGKVYLKGTGRVQVNFTDEKITKTSPPPVVQPIGSGDASGVSAEYVDKKDADTLAAAKEYADMLKADLSGYVGYTNNDIYGLEADFENGVFTRLAGAVGKTAGADFDSVRAYGGRRRCNLSDSGEVLAYYGDKKFKADGSNGQVMVEQPKFYYKVVPLKVEKIDGADGYHLRKARYYISDTPKAGFKVHPAFIRSGVETDRIYLSAFEGCIYDTSAEVYLLNDEQVADFGADMLSSIAGAKPCSGLTQKLTRANTRKLAHNRGEGWEQTTIQAVSVTQLLFVVEYAGFNSQTTLARGPVDSPSSYESVRQTGATLSLGNVSGTTDTADNIQFVSYRGEENLWGNIWAFIDGVNINNPAVWNDGLFGELYVSDHGFADDIGTAPYEKTDIYPCFGNGNVSAFGFSHKFDWIFFASEDTGSTSLPIGDYFSNGSNKSGWNKVCHGGFAGDKASPGLFEFNVGSAADHYGSFGTRLFYFPPSS